MREAQAQHLFLCFSLSLSLQELEEEQEEEEDDEKAKEQTGEMTSTKGGERQHRAASRAGLVPWQAGSRARWAARR